MNLITNSTNQLLETALSSSMTRQNTISQNIANVDTPNYKAKQTVFAHELNQAQANQKLNANRTDNRHIQFGGGPSDESAKIVSRNNTTYNHNGNNVDIDSEMSELAKNQIYYNTLVDRLNGRFNSIRTVLGQGR
ncbi:flagellar basal body rod protein FlgB [Salipaludibacillus agaradhaerens]|jgi:flagellar basal-body rod protein FlgB|uniref:Flagellar basal body rod protein FlgB n=1 Tax=Salipaludibacillus agaradhaerens TaxID=76935 RepID=A0A9Q4B0C0_SALAG|nr:flagellar basal body rod protein FlgB [Salipaludibacillus agaradhaerens]MCR6111127.1 flagellar basal body rod protein FlgB [Bacillus sp. A301a_S52]UJW58158.1 flagellar basal body rod protein FlgB [Bacillus sp. A116_S68]MCR6096036.1 flagellar basal body rod protein FlgB [Salipaludibacillus agaradhaerens]MCR6107076.1 flagellar basal body rod protein FlgB [Salipaludibacillus agaradhaerens]MCR6114405.1 flagellar basal body rod protein FlgB [Salipaludibacillus agaradhaerens]